MKQCSCGIKQQWLTHSLQPILYTNFINVFSEPSMYSLRDIKSEKEMQCNLQESISRAQAKPLFQVSKEITFSQL